MNDFSRKALPTPAEYSTQRAQRHLRINASSLRTLADTFEQLANLLEMVPRPGREWAAEVAGRAVHEHAVWLMSAQLHTAVQHAAEADRYRIEAAAEDAARLASAETRSTQED